MLDSGVEPEERRGLVNEGASLGLSISGTDCPFKANGRRRRDRSCGAARRGGRGRIPGLRLAQETRHSDQIWAG